MTLAEDKPRPAVLLPGYWLGGWAWDAVAERLRTGGHDVTATTLPGPAGRIGAPDGVHFADHVAAVRDALPPAGPHAVLVAHRGAGAVANAVLDAVPDRVARVVYVDSGATADGAVPLPDLADDECCATSDATPCPPPWCAAPSRARRCVP